MKIKGLILLSYLVIVSCSDDTCSKDDQLCNEKEENKFTDADNKIQPLLDEIEQLRRSELNRAYEKIKLLLVEFPDNAKGILLLAKIQRSLYSKLHPKMRDIGKIELLNPSLNALHKILKMPAEQLPDKQHAETAEFASANALGSGNKTMSVRMLKTILERQNPAIDKDTYRYYFDMLAEELYYDKKFSEALQLIENILVMFKGPNSEIKLLKALITRYNEVVNKEPFIVSHDTLKKIKPSTDDEKREIIMFVNDLETELRKLRRTTEVYTLFELCEELGVFPSKYQRANMLFDNLKAQPLWAIEETGQNERFMKIQENWKQIKREMTNLTNELEDWEWKENALDPQGLLSEYFFLGNGLTSLPARPCMIAPTFCEIIKQFNLVQECALCEVKLQFIEPSAHVRPHCGPTNAKLTTVFPVSVLSSNITKVQTDESPFRMRIADDTVHWEEGKPSVFDSSFETELWNRSGSPKLLLVIDFKHPDLQPEDDILDLKHWDIVNVDGGAVYQMKQNILS